MMGRDDGDGVLVRRGVMPMRRLMWLPWALFLLAILMATFDLVVAIQNDQAAGLHESLSGWLIRVESAVLPISFTAVGAYIVTRRPDNRIGRLMIAIGLAFALVGLMSDYP